MNILLDALPQTVKIGPLVYPIRTDFRIWIMLEQLLGDGALTAEEKISGAFELAYDKPIIDENEALERIVWFYLCGKDVQVAAGDDEDKPITTVFDWDYDADYIYAAFMGQYGIDLQEANLHWWKFKALFAGLKEDNKLCKIMSYRAMEIPGDMPKSQKEFYKKMKKLYAIPLPQAVQEQLNAIEQALLNGGDLRGVL